jgi:MscS family membrane protein
MALASLVLGRLLAAGTRCALMPIVSRTTNAIDDELVGRSIGPLALGWSAIACLIALPWLDLRASAHRSLDRMLTALVILAFFWALLRSLDVLKDALLRAPRTAAHPSAVGLIDIGTRLSKLLVVAMGVTIALSQFGYSVSGLVTGLGIGGLAVALAFQKTGENLFGSIALGVDQPFRVGDFVAVDGTLGNIEAIGLRSTRVRTLDRTLVTIPNGKLADMKIESYAARDRIRLDIVLRLVRATTPAQLRDVLGRVEATLREHPHIWPDNVIVRFAAIGNDSLDLKVMAWFQTHEMSEFEVYRQEVLLAFLEGVEAAGTRLALPAQTLHLDSGLVDPPDAKKPPPRESRVEALWVESNPGSLTPRTRSRSRTSPSSSGC